MSPHHPFTRLFRGAMRIAALSTLAACSATPPTAPDAEPLPPAGPEASDPPSSPEGAGGSDGGVEVIASGRFGGLGGHSASGGVSLRMFEGGGEVILAEDFRSSRVPDPHLYVATEPDANRGDRLRIATLQRNDGAQSYGFRLPAGFAYRYVLVWCDKYNVGVGAARLTPAPSGNLP